MSAGWPDVEPLTPVELVGCAVLILASWAVALVVVIAVGGMVT